MNIFKDRKEHSSEEHGPMKHMLHMILCCGLPVIIILSLPFIARISPPVAGILGVIAPFICPVMMGTMIFMMFRRGKHSCCEETDTDSSRTLPQNDKPVN